MRRSPSNERHLLLHRPRPARVGLARLAAGLVLGIAVAGCLPASIRPTPPPTPTPVPTPTPLPTPTPPPPPPTPTPAPTFETYVVRRGDTLTSIAKAFRTDGRSIAYWNRAAYPSLDPESARYAPNRLEVGWTFQVLRGGTYVPPDTGPSDLPYTPAPTEDLSDGTATETPGASASP